MPAFIPLTPVGVRITDARVDELDDAQIDDVRTALATHGVVVLPGQELDDDAFLRFVRRFGETVFTVGETPVPERPELNVVTNVGRTRPPRSTFHTDTSYISNPPAYTALRAVSVPEKGGQTLFTNQYAAYDTLPRHLREVLQGRTITHVVTGVTPDGRQESAATHPIFLTHPVSGRTALYLSTPERCAEVSGMSADDAAATVAYLFEHSTRDDNVYRHAWSPGDVVMWDNRCVLHKADHDGVVGDRVLHRGMVAAPA
ncbi:TauD/TfdA family dioxygenase [Mycolicibacterium sp. P1-18]|uniref:TauD/TfdA dioxygenase family protein n=1 Tax=Mycolicibacterium sp. P1-18 TaxID=2024615 RepID=UPI0011F26912|nr:TauD/TfdA family dioxygenase [Mycolicibacterium sp. P1-18]KAA0102342.1 TauD/TfdA family dioxygenase [Mycolicibacterium sp. P1-18]